MDHIKIIEDALKRFKELVESLECECDPYNGFACSIHDDRIKAELALESFEELSTNE